MQRTTLAWLTLALVAPVVLPFGQAERVSTDPPILVASLVDPSFSDLNENRVFDDLDAALPTMTSDERTTVIVLFTRPVASEDVEAYQGEYGPFPVNAIWTLVPGFSANLTASQILAFAAREDVVLVEKERIFTTALITARPTFGVDKAVADYGVTGDRFGGDEGYSLSDVLVCIADTGIDIAHPDLNQGQVRLWRDFINGRTSPYDDHGHGTHVAGILAGQGDENWAQRGVAYGASLAVAKVLSGSGSGTTTSVISGINWCADRGVRIVSLSLGSSGSSNGADSLSQAVNALADRGIIPVVAAGNGGDSAYTIGSPAAAEKAITVCAMADAGASKLGFYLAQFSSRGPTADGRIKPDICGPGVNILSARPGGGYTGSSGTSMSTPFVAGVLALMIDARPSLTVAGAKDCLYRSAQDWGALGKDPETGYGRLRAYQAIACAAGIAGAPPSDPAHWFKRSSLASPGTVHEWQLPVSNLHYPLALTLLGSNPAAGKDFDLYVYAPSGLWVGSSAGTTRQETVAFMPTVTGNYRAVVYAASGAGAYTLDVSNANPDPVPRVPSG